jgi:3-dehydroquinate synthase
MSAIRSVCVPLGARSYEVRIGPGVLNMLGPACRALGAARVVVAADSQAARHWLEPAMRSLDAAGVAGAPVLIPAGEDSKSFRGLETLCTALLEAGLERRDLVVALGGGVAGDLAGFAAGVLKRGVDFVQVPTTLLAQVDSSVGGKTGINTPAGKNLIGLFHQPRLVLADTDTLATLPARQLRAGFAEVVKYGLIDDPALFAWCEREAEHVLAGAGAALTEAVAASVAAKARVVGADERESGARALLNLGHTFGHALEAIAGYDGRLLHGEAVATGMALAFRFSAALGLCPAQDVRAVEALLARCGFAVRLREAAGGPFEPAAMLAAMAHDKKAEGGELTLILARGVGAAFVHKRTSSAALARFLEEEQAR